MNKKGLTVWGTVFFTGILLTIIVFVVAPINKANANLAVNEIGITGIEAFLISDLNIFFFVLALIFITAAAYSAGVFNTR